MLLVRHPWFYTPGREIPPEEQKRDTTRRTEEMLILLNCSIKIKSKLYV
jgi:hypothetical protein